MLSKVYGNLHENANSTVHSQTAIVLTQELFLCFLACLSFIPLAYYKEKPLAKF